MLKLSPKTISTVLLGSTMTAAYAAPHEHCGIQQDTVHSETPAQLKLKVVHSPWVLPEMIVGIEQVDVHGDEQLELVVIGQQNISVLDGATQDLIKQFSFGVQSADGYALGYFTQTNHIELALADGQVFDLSGMSEKLVYTFDLSPFGIAAGQKLSALPACGASQERYIDAAYEVVSTSFAGIQQTKTALTAGQQNLLGVATKDQLFALNLDLSQEVAALRLGGGNKAPYAESSYFTYSWDGDYIKVEGKFAAKDPEYEKITFHVVNGPYFKTGIKNNNARLGEVKVDNMLGTFSYEAYLPVLEGSKRSFYDYVLEFQFYAEDASKNRSLIKRTELRPDASQLGQKQQGETVTSNNNGKQISKKKDQEGAFFFLLAPLLVLVRRYKSTL
ncbi:hypothetical protein [Algicola sagamiensis]|uniref:hypothetical protein n=1 Tax=Algicola sagamiensis TaxID=163869 RepID=UPI0003723408|nr:hypothetical protein [Algicola sagamiensis]